MISVVLAGQLQQTVLDYLKTTFSLASTEFEARLHAILAGDDRPFRGPSSTCAGSSADLVERVARGEAVHRLSSRTARRNSIQTDGLRSKHDGHLLARDISRPRALPRRARPLGGVDAADLRVPERRSLTPPRALVVQAGPRSRGHTSGA